MNLRARIQQLRSEAALFDKYGQEASARLLSEVAADLETDVDELEENDEVVPRKKKQTAPRGSDSGVYIIHAVGTGLYKIGYTNHIAERLCTLRGAAPCELKVAAFLVGLDRADERGLHARFRAYRKHGEWFEDSEMLRDLIAEHPAS